MANDTAHGRFHIAYVYLQARFDAGDLIFKDPQVFYSVSNATRDEKRKILVLIF